jgi:hypothetical protein
VFVFCYQFAFEKPIIFYSIISTTQQPRDKRKISNNLGYSGEKAAFVGGAEMKGDRMMSINLSPFILISF